MEQTERQTFNELLKSIYGVAYKNFQVSFVNGQLPNFFTIIFSIILTISGLTSKIIWIF